MNTTFLDACFGKKTPYTPVWIMRQAGRYLPEYRRLKGNKNILDIVRAPDLAAEIALLPVDILEVDAAVLYADIMIPLLGIGVDLEIEENIGPIIKNPLKSLLDVKKLRSLEPERDVPYLLETVSLLKNTLDVPLIGFSAAPFTLASYLIEGRSSRDFARTKAFMYTQREAWDLLMEKLSGLITIYLKAQKNAGVDAIQVFDSWVGCLSDRDYREYVLPATKKIFSSLHDGVVPLIHFGTNTAAFLKPFSSVSTEVVSVDWRMPLNRAWEIIGKDKAIQGNLDPAVLLGDFSLVRERVNEMFALLPKKDGYVFNLGHGVLPDTSPENVKKLIAYVHQK